MSILHETLNILNQLAALGMSPERAASMSGEMVSQGIHLLF
ncbi:hypothetical protein RM844_17180 [Streptomyces sp. DSM 44915]|uniref:Uncharacterized protein n=1 Tax=Streptomyces chisholmiae TaxID=3075540 RepID=A0ABU2JSQ4_9ACTN|nr:hypothetical protein [Streptomyces sp. DSM 44915]MDT0268016.1 hypothetical protein [Streptomyces sp. DSM 44915]